MSQYEVTVSNTNLHEPKKTDLVLYFPKGTKVVKILSITVNSKNEMLNYCIAKDDFYVKITPFTSLIGDHLINCEKGILSLKCILQSSTSIESTDLRGTVTYERSNEGLIDGRNKELARIKIRKRTHSAPSQQNPPLK